MTRHVLAIDQGTTSTRAIAVSTPQRARRRPRSRSSRSIYPRPAGSSTTRRTSGARRSRPAATALAKAGLAPRDIAAIGITNQRETTLVWDRAPASRSTTPSSGRTAAPPPHVPQLERRRPRGAGRARAPACCSIPISPPPSSPGCSTHVAGARARGRARRARLRHRRHLPALAADRRARARHRRHQRLAHRCSSTSTPAHWDAELLAAVRHPARAAARGARLRRPSSARPRPAVRRADRRSAASPATSRRRPSARPASRPGMVKSTYGTGCFLLLNTGGSAVASRNRLLTTVAYQLGGQRTYALEGAIFVAGAAVQWLRDGLGLIRHAAETEALAAAADPGHERLSGAGLRRPRRAPLGRRGARRALRPHPRHRPARTRPRRARKRRLPDPRPDRGDARRLARGGADTVLRVDGGMAASDWTMQFLADMLDAPVDRPAVLETTALGAAYLAGLQRASIRSREHFAERWALDRRFTPPWMPKRARASSPPGRTRCAAH